MRIVVLFINYLIFIIWILALLSLLSEFSGDVILWAIIMFIVTVPNIIYIHNTKPVDLEKENLKKQIEELKKAQIN